MIALNKRTPYFYPTSNRFNLDKRGDVNPRKIGIVSVSLGGYYAPRFAACIVWGA